jgi:1,4-dihydroxy-2-naphthoate octaprenyltransferase
MENKGFSPRILVSIAQPLNILFCMFTYLLGLGILHYIGSGIDWPVAILGSFIVIMILLSRAYLGAYFRYPDPVQSMGITRTDPDGELKFTETKDIPREILLQMSLATLGLGAAATVIAFILQAVNVSSFLVLSLSLALVLIDVLPPIQLGKKGYSEIIEAFLIANIAPTLAFLLQGENLQLLVLMLTLPLTFIYLSLKIASSFEYYAYDTKHTTGSLLSRAGWQRGVAVHNLSLVFAFLFYAIFLVFGLAWRLCWPVFIALPVAVLQIIQMVRIAEGAKPNWRLFRANALSTFLFVVYLITFTLWVY